MAERDTGPEPDGSDRSGGAGVPADPVAIRQDAVPRQLPAGPTATGGHASTAVSDYSPLRTANRRGQQAADLRQKLDEKAAATDELREALDELRQVLDVDNPPPASATGRRRTRLFVLLGLAVVAALVLWMLLDRGSSGIISSSPSASTSPARSAAAGAGAGATASGASSGASSATSAARSTTPATAAKASSSVAVKPLPWPGGAVRTPPGLTTSGPGASAPGTDVQVAVDADGVHLDVFERLLLDTPTADPITLATPTLPALSATTRVEDLQVQLDDTPVAVTPDGPDSWTAVPTGGNYTHVTLRYRVGNGVTLITPAAPGRSLGLVTPLTAVISTGHGHAVQVRATDSTVLGISCPAAPRGAVCGARTSAGWVATIPADSQPMIALLQLNTKR